MTNINKPQFTPSGGVGTIWKDPASGKTWKFETTGWIEAGTVNKEVKKETFQVKPEEEQLVNTLKIGGAKEVDIQNALKQRQEILSTTETTVDEDIESLNTINTNVSDPFKGKSKVEILRDAFNNGVTDIAELDKIGQTYDLLASVGDETENQYGDLDTLPLPEQQKIMNSVKSQVASKAQSLGSQSEREGVMEALGTLQTGQEIIESIESGIETGPIAGATRKGVSVFGVKAIPGKRTLGKTKPEEDRFAALVNVYTARFIKAISGAQVSDAERKFLMESLPSETKQEQENIEGIKAISDYLANRYSPTVGVDMSPLIPRSGNTTDPLKLLQGGTNINNPLGI